MRAYEEKLGQFIYRTGLLMKPVYDRARSDYLRAIEAFGEALREAPESPDLHLYLASTYEPGDLVHIFGFSRGAYTARSLVGLIRNAGLLKPEHLDLAREAYGLYRTRDEGAD